MASRLSQLVLFVALTFLSAPSAHAANNLFLVWDANTAVCVPKVSRFFDCLLSLTDFNPLIAEYPGGRQLTLDGTAVLAASCLPSDFQCIASATGFSFGDQDVLIHYYGDAGYTGGRDVTSVVTIGGTPVTLQVAWIETGSDCDAQTCAGSHEVFESATDGNSADCCNGQSFPQCAQCDATCPAFGAAHPGGCFPLTCGGTIYSTQYVGRASNEFTGSGCTAVHATPCDGTPVHGQCSATSECCEGLVCSAWSPSNGPPFANACCNPVGSGCGNDADCCGGTRCNTELGACACTAADHFCVESGECCDGACDSTTHTCAPRATFTPGGGCSSVISSPNANAGVWAVLAALAVCGARRVRSKRSTPR